MLTDIISFDQLDTKTLSLIFKTADGIKKSFKNKKTLEILKGKVITLLFFEPSSRTFSSFASAAKRLGAQTIEYQNPMQTSSAVKGETLEDTIKVFSAYSDLIIIRHPEIGAASRAANVTDIPVINAGDGAGEHPSQALLDLYTIREQFGRLDRLKGLIAGDFLYGRAVRSLLKALCLYKNNSIYLLSPKELSLSKKDVYLYKSRGLKIFEIDSEKNIPRDCDFWYWTRVQKERFKNKTASNKIKAPYLSTALLKAKGNNKMIVMHVLPRIDEVDREVDNDLRCIFLTKQIKNGMYVRMALLKLILK